MTQVKNYRQGTYIWVNGELVPKNYNRTYRGKPTKHIDKMNDKREEVRAGIAYIITCILILGGYAVFSMNNNIVLNVEAQGATSEDVIVKDVAPVSYEGIPYMERVEVKDFTVDNWKSIGTYTVSAYSELDSCHYPTMKNGFRQCLVASGKVAKVGMVATNLYPFGTRLRINGNIYIVEDRISKRYNNRIDLFVGYGEEASKEATEFGIKSFEVEILNN